MSHSLNGLAIFFLNHENEICTDGRWFVVHIFGNSYKWWLIPKLVHKSLLTLNCNRNGLMGFKSFGSGPVL